jgi:deoxyribose-phosphate aldolase
MLTFCNRLKAVLSLLTNYFPKDMDIASYIDHTLLKADCTPADIRQICEEAQAFQFAAVCIPPYYVTEAVALLSQLQAKSRVATVVGFPMGYSSTIAKVEEIKRALDEGAEEVDVVINICAVKSGQWGFLQNDIDSMTTAARLRGKKIKTIIETGLLTDEEIRKVCDILLEVQPDYVKTSTGLLGKGPTPEVIKTLAELVQDKIKIKASGGIRTRAEAEAMIKAGAHRIGTSAGVAIVQP